MMNPELKAKWLEALRSGEYKQGIGSLNEGGKLCCLGVLCEIDPSVTKVPIDAKSNFYKFNDGVMAGWLSDDYACAIGLSKHALVDLAVRNDNQGWDFDMIADYIEETY